MAPRVARGMLRKQGMRTFLGLIAAVAIIGGVLKYRERQEPAANAVTAPPAASAATPRHFPKQALDRAAEVKREVAKEHASNESN